jgi:nucleoside-diphosphate-sugar epimerase
MQTVLGLGGAIGVELAKALKRFTDKIRLVSRNPQAVNPHDDVMSADLTKPDDVFRAVKDSQIVYLMVGLPYRLSVWKEAWPTLMQNVINACKRHQVKLVFFDNIYMYEPKHMCFMTEDTPIGPTSQKGIIRKNVAQMLIDETNEGSLQALIAQSADFYGPQIKNTSILTEMVLKNLAKGKKAVWLGSPDYKHSFTYAPDAGKATALLGNTPDAYNQVWHLPTAADPLTGKEWIKAIAKTMGVALRFRSINSIIVRILGLFMPIMKELAEIMYQYDQDYVFHSGKFNKHFDFKPTDYQAGIQHVVNAARLK